MGQLKITTAIDGLHVRFPGNGLPSTSPSGKLFMLLFWVCCFSPMWFGDNTAWMALVVAAAVAMVWLGRRTKQLRLHLSDVAVRLSSPRSSRTVRLEDIDTVEVRKDENMGYRYVVLVCGPDEVVVDALLKQADADALAARIEQARQARVRDAAEGRAEVPAALAALRAQGAKPLSR